MELWKWGKGLNRCSVAPEDETGGLDLKEWREWSRSYIGLPISLACSAVVLVGWRKKVCDLLGMKAQRERETIAGVLL